MEALIRLTFEDPDKAIYGPNDDHLAANGNLRGCHDLCLAISGRAAP